MNKRLVHAENPLGMTKNAILVALCQKCPHCRKDIPVIDPDEWCTTKAPSTSSRARRVQRAPKRYSVARASLRASCSTRVNGPIGPWSADSSPM